MNNEVKPIISWGCYSSWALQGEAGPLAELVVPEMGRQEHS